MENSLMIDKLTINDIVDYVIINGAQAGADLMLLAGPDNVDCSIDVYNDLFKNLTKE